jgi:3D (Asp-Asp-Asp) domain-containing protein
MTTKKTVRVGQMEVISPEKVDNKAKATKLATYWLVVALGIATMASVASVFATKRVLTLVRQESARLDEIRGLREATFFQVYKVDGEISAYSSEFSQTDSTPEVTAANTKVGPGIVANNCLPFGTRVIIHDILYEVWDRMNQRYGCDTFDIWKSNKNDALEFGRQYDEVIILNY